MPRTARIIAEGYPHHVTQRGNFRQKVFETLNALAELGFLVGTKKSKSVGLTEEGIAKAIKLKEKYLK